ncbi:hypothetical protein M885DRAFT_521596 [Pelagophyceae sp. CCMP2097]|nr:hypothetical protein M885DRAFT_521596 [Pelagophyceae sp. CCMP2097]
MSGGSRPAGGYEAVEASPRAPSMGREGALLLASHSCTVIFSTAWEFTLPLALLQLWGGNSLRAPSALTLAVTSTTMLWAPRIGELADGADRLRAVRLARCAQVAGTALSLGALLGMANCAPESLGHAKLGWLGPLLLGACLEALGGLVTRAAPKKDWAPTLFEGEYLSSCTSWLSTISQVGEIAGPFLGALAVGSLGASRGAALMGASKVAQKRDTPPRNPRRPKGKRAPPKGTTAKSASVGAAAVVLEVPAQLPLEVLYRRSPALRLRPGESGACVEAAGKADESAWAVWLRQPAGTAVLTMSFSLLFFTALAPHGAVLTAYLATRSVDPLTISAFRALGAVSGLAGIAVFGRASRATEATEGDDMLGGASAARVRALRRASFGALVSQAVAACVAAAALACFPADSAAALRVFLAAVVATRFGLYAYDVGYLELQQLLVDESCRNACQGCEAALCGGAELAVAAVTLMACADPADFAKLAFASAACVVAALLLLALWAALFHAHGHSHAADAHADAHAHAHTAQQARVLRDGAGRHVHVHYSGPSLVWPHHDNHGAEGSHSHAHAHAHA